MMSSSLERLLMILALVATCLMAACGTDKDARQNDGGESITGQPTKTVEESEDEIIEYLDTTGDGTPDIVRYFEVYEHPREEDRMARRLRKMEIDVTGDEQFNVRRFYDEFGNVSREENDLDLDGTMDTILYFVGGELARKELLDPEQDIVVERRVYLDGELARVELDRQGTGTIDRWEYYENGVLVRIGRDTSGDGSVDTWQLR